MESKIVTTIDIQLIAQTEQNLRLMNNKHRKDVSSSGMETNTINVDSFRFNRHISGSVDPKMFDDGKKCEFEKWPVVWWRDGVK